MDFSQMLERPRRLRGNPLIRSMVRETRISKSSLIYPMFVRDGQNILEPIPSLDGQMRCSVDRLGDILEPVLESGVRNVMLFGIPEHKDEAGSQAYAEDGVVQRALRFAKEHYPELYLITDVCMCEYTSHGHCGVLCGCEVDNDKTLPLIAKTALSHVQAGADMVAPSDMMDGRILAIRQELDKNGYVSTPIMSYAVKYSSAFYGPFRDAAGSAPSFGDRKGYQMDFHNRIIKFAGCYHGHSDAMLVRAGSGVMTSGIPDSAGVPAACAADTLTAVYNDLSSVEMLFGQNPGEIAAVIVEPVAANMGVVEPAPGFLAGLREICDKNGALLIFDEVITGFRLALGGAQEYFGVRADLVTFGKIIGAGMPVGAYGGRRDVMSVISPRGSVYQAGTLSGNPVAMAAGLTQLTILRDTPAVYQKINALGDFFRQEMRKMTAQTGVPVTVTGVGSLSCIFFTPNPVHNYTGAKNSDTALFAKYFLYMLDKGFYFAPSQLEAIFLSAAHTEENIRDAVQTAQAFFQCQGTPKGV